jgi:hypothetical protein
MEESRYIYRASGDSCPVTEFSEQMDTLRVSGAYVDVIVTIGELCIMNAGFLNVLERWMHLSIGEMRESAPMLR